MTNTESLDQRLHAKMLQSSPWNRIANVVFRREHNTVSPLSNVGSHPPQLAGPAETRETNLLFSPAVAQAMSDVTAQVDRNLALL